MLWPELKSFLQRKVRPINKQKLIDGITKLWFKMQYIDRVYKVLPIERGGSRATGH